MTAKRGFSLYREATSNTGGGCGDGVANDDDEDDALSKRTEGDSIEGGGDTAGSLVGLGQEWIELVSVEVFSGDGDLDDKTGFI